jgi:hypothetical protein
VIEHWASLTGGTAGFNAPGRLEPPRLLMVSDTAGGV